jgi:predicted DNA-binding transcriptional regulator YafY
MSAQGTIRRWTLIIEKITSQQNPSFQVLKDYLHGHGFEISPRTLQRDIEQIRYEFGIEIKYNRAQNGYYIDKSESINLDSFLRFLEIINTANLISDSLKDGKDALNYISFESQGNLKGIENLKSLLFAIKNHRRIVFTHENFETGKKREYSMKPYLLKEYQNRWYIVGLFTGLNEFRTFGIDRIENLQVLSETFEPNLKLNPAKLFENTVGLVYSYNELEDVILSFTPLQAKYIKSLPLHKSQEIIKETSKEVIVKLNVIPNFELKQKILMLGDQVKVLKPKWFAKDVKTSLNNSLRAYKKH